MTPTERFWSHVEVRGPDECWPWTASLHVGYGHLLVERAKVLVHRFSYEIHVGRIPDGLMIDHVCHNRSLDCPGGPCCPHRRCVNPAHLDVVTSAENTRRSPLWRCLRTHCKHGHPFDVANTYITTDGRRQCKACSRERTKVRRMRIPKAKETSE